MVRYYTNLDSIASENTDERVFARLKTELHECAAQLLGDLVHFRVLEPFVRFVCARLPAQVVAVIFILKEKNNKNFFELFSC